MTCSAATCEAEVCSASFVVVESNRCVDTPSEKGVDCADDIITYEPLRKGPNYPNTQLPNAPL